MMPSYLGRKKEISQKTTDRRTSQSWYGMNKMMMTRQKIPEIIFMVTFRS